MTSEMMEILDQMGNTVRLPKYPQRVISLVPSLTELLFELGLDNEIVGITSFCVLPENQVAGRVRIGGTKHFDYPLIDGLKPDLIIGSKEENYREGILWLKERYPVWICDVVTVEDALDMILKVGALVNCRANADTLVRKISMEMAGLPVFQQMQAAYLIWKDPFMVAGGGTFINEMLHKCGFTNLFENKGRYPQINLGELQDAEVILLSSEPYSFTDEDIAFFKARYPHQRVLTVDGKMFSWYGSRMKYAPEYFKFIRSNLAMAQR